MQIEKKTLRNIFLCVLGCIFFYWIITQADQFKSVLDVIKRVLSPFILGACLAFIINVPMRAIEKLLKFVKNPTLRRTIAITLTVVCVLLVITLVVLLLVSQLTETVPTVIDKIESFVYRVQTDGKAYLDNNPHILEWLVENTDFESMDWAGLAEKAITALGNSVTAIISGVFATVGRITGAVMEAFIAVVFAIYCLFQKETLARQGRKLLYAFLPEKFADRSIYILRLSNSTFSNFLSGQCLEVCILGSLFAVAMTIFRMEHVALISILVAVTAFIPLVGAWVGCIIGAFLIFITNPVQAIWFVVMFVVLQQIENNLIYPRVVGTSIGLSGMWVLVAVGLGGELMGVAGMFLMIPITSVIYTVLREITNERLSKGTVDPQKLEIQPPEVRTRAKVKKNNKKSSSEEENN